MECFFAADLIYFMGRTLFGPGFARANQIRSIMPPMRMTLSANGRDSGSNDQWLKTNR